jgi:hypothetical protein
MTHPSVVAIQHGWKVFAKDEEIGHVVDVAPGHIDIQRGLLTKHHYRVPQSLITEAADGVVDLDVDRASVEAFEVDRSDRGATETASPAELPDDYRRLEHTDPADGSKDPPDLRGLPR